MKNKRKALIIGTGAIITLMVAVFIYFNYQKQKSAELTYNPAVEETYITVKHNLSELYSGNYYIWTNPGGTDYENLALRQDVNEFKILSAADNNFDANNTTHVFWYNSKNDGYIPTMYEDDVLIYTSNKSIPYAGINWQRFADYGYTIGIIGLHRDPSGHYYLYADSSKRYEGKYYIKSDASKINKLSDVNALHLDKIGGKPVRDNNVSPMGTIIGLNKNTQYMCEWYTGSYIKEIKMTSNVHIFGIMESFSTYNYEFEHSGFIVIKIPNWFKTGYYFIDGYGFFRYVKNKDKELYNGEAYDPYINWNDPIIIKDDEGHVLYNPITGEDRRNDNIDDSNNNIKGDSGWDE